MMQMETRWHALLFVLVSGVVFPSVSSGTEDQPDVVLVILVRNQARFLPKFLGTIDRLTFPKKDTFLWVRTDHNYDNTGEILAEWVGNVKQLYKGVNYKLTEGYTEYSKQEDRIVWDWTEKKLIHISNLRQGALDFARNVFADYLLFIDADVFITDSDIVQHLIAESTESKAAVTSPLIGVAEHPYSNFWGEISEQGWYKRSPNYMDIVYRVNRGYFPVSLVHTSFLVDLRDAKSADFSFTKPLPESVYPGNQGPNDALRFCYSVTATGATIVISNTYKYGQMTRPTFQTRSTEQTRQDTSRLILKLTETGTDLSPSKHIRPKPSKLSKDFNKIYIVNQKKNTEKRSLMQQVMFDLGVENYVIFEGVDWMHLDDTYLESLGAKTLKAYQDLISDPGQRKREIGQFLSHYFIWNEAAEMGYENILIMEDDAVPIDSLMHEYVSVMGEARRVPGGWDLLYLGRKLTDELDETQRWIPGFQYVYRPGYSNWTIAYALSRRGLNKLLIQHPLEKIVPTDQYLPILMDLHPNKELKKHFFPRDLAGLSANPLLLFPKDYPEDMSYVYAMEDYSEYPNKDDSQYPNSGKKTQSDRDEL